MLLGEAVRWYVGASVVLGEAVTWYVGTSALLGEAEPCKRAETSVKTSKLTIEERFFI